MNTFNFIWSTITLVGALGLFLFGMKLMSEALQKVAGSKMRHILGAMTNNRFKGAFTGLLVTTTIQSSSATTVMVVSFVNAGLLSLTGAVAVIMGANIGTTVTAWIISLLGFKVSLSFLSLPLIGLSFPLLFAKGGLRKSWGEFIIGFAILFIGLQFLKESVPDIKSNPEAFQFLTAYTDMGFWSVILFVAIGTLLTIIIQSSSATMALTLVMTYNGLIPFEMAAAMVLGENIGTTITANLAALVANTSAKRAARAHLLFNLFGVAWILAVFYPFLRGIDYIVNINHGISVLKTDLSTADFESVKNAYPIALSLFHTLFNIINTFLLIGFVDFIAKIATRLVKQKEEEDEEFRLKYINTGLLSTSEISTVLAQKEISVFGHRVEKMFGFIPQLFEEQKPKKFQKLIERIKKYEEITDNLEDEIAAYLSKMLEGEVSSESSKKILAMLAIIDNLESNADVIYQISRVVEQNYERKVKIPEEQIKLLGELWTLVKASFNEMNNNLEQSLWSVKPDKAHKLERDINAKRNELRLRHFEDLKAKKYKHKVGVFYTDLFSLSEKIGDYVINVTEAIEDSKKY
jgi:phosphate:Na+ symporter